MQYAIDKPTEEAARKPVYERFLVTIELGYFGTSWSN
jgi:hypothetical protein